MIDIHSHILPGVDDGVASLEEALELARQSLENGVRCMVATPHYNYRGSASMKDIQQAYAELIDALEYEQLPLRLRLAMEIMASEDLPQLLQEGKVLTYPDSRYFLVEFMPGETAEFMDQLLRQCHEAGFIPVIAHPERYVAIRDDLRLLRRWKRKGYVIQLDRDSLLGAFGGHTAYCAGYLMYHGVADCIASDAHELWQRNGCWDSAFALFDRKFDPSQVKKCLYTVPRKILNNEDMD